jgi:hypothetical protein
MIFAAGFSGGGAGGVAGGSPGGPSPSGGVAGRNKKYFINFIFIGL